MVAGFEENLNVEFIKQKNLDIVEEKNSRREELPEKYTAKILYRQDDGKFENKYLKKLERNWQKQKLVSLEDKP